MGSSPTRGVRGVFFVFFCLRLLQLYDWAHTNRHLLLELCREQQSGEDGVMTTDAFTSVLHTMGAPLQPDHITSLLTIYDKKGEGVINYDDFISEQKYIHAVSHSQLHIHIHIRRSRRIIYFYTAI